jgi:ABC-type amino acid transport substrate-binding protein
VLVTKKGSPLNTVDSFSDPKLKGKRIGIIAGTTPTDYLVLNDLIDNVRSYPLVVDTRFSNSSKDMMKDLQSGDIDAAVMWGPIGGYLAKMSKVPVNVVPMVKDKNGPALVFRICMGVRQSDQNWKRTLNKLIAANQPEINAILTSYGVPLLNEQDQPITH